MASKKQPPDPTKPDDTVTTTPPDCATEWNNLKAATAALGDASSVWLAANANLNAAMGSFNTAFAAYQKCIGG